MPILNVCNLCKTYQAGEAEVKALDNVSFTVEKGEFVSIIGPSGSGKSTLLHILAGIDRPTSGKVYVDGEDIYAKSEKELAYYRRRKAGLIYQFYNLVPTLTVEENITLPCRLDKKKTDKETLYRLAKKNTPQLLPPQLTPMSSLLKEIQLVAETPLPEAAPPLYVLTNTYRTNGATVLLYDDILKELSDLFEKDLIILPSSIQVLILAADENDRQNLDHYTAMVKEVNASQLQDEEILSDHAYYYCRHSHLLTMPQPVCTS